MGNGHNAGPCILAMVTIALAGLQPVQAADWQHSFSVPLRAEYDSNPLLLTEGTKSIWRGTFSPAYDVVALYGVDEFKAQLGLNIERSSDELISQNREDPRASLDWRRTTRTGFLALAAKYDRRSTRYSELEESGAQVRDGTRTSRLATGLWSGQLTDRATLGADAGYTYVTYGGGDLVDYVNSTAGASFEYARDDRLVAFSRLSFGRFDPAESPQSPSNNTSLQAGLRLQTSENLDWTVQFGPAYTSGQVSDLTWLGSLKLRYRAPTYDASLEAGRYIQGSGSEGGFLESEQVVGALSYTLDERTRVGLVASWRDSSGVSPTTFQRVRVWASRRLSPSWNVRLDCEYRQRREAGQPKASGTLASVTLTYDHPGL